MLHGQIIGMYIESMVFVQFRYVHKFHAGAIS